MAETEKPEENYPLPFKRSYWIIPGRFLAGALPSSPVTQERSENVQDFLNLAGIDVSRGTGNHHFQSVVNDFPYHLN